MTQNLKEGDVVWVKGEVTGFRGNDYIQVSIPNSSESRHGINFKSNLVHPAPVADYPAEVTDRMLAAYRKALATPEPDDMVRNALQEVLKAAPRQETGYPAALDITTEMIEEAQAARDDYCNRLGVRPYEDRHAVKEMLEGALDAAPRQECQSKDVSDRQEVDPHSEPVRRLLADFMIWLYDNWVCARPEDPRDAIADGGLIVAHGLVHDFLATLKDKAEPAKPSAIDEIATERRRQIEVEGFGAEHDDSWQSNELADAAHCYITGSGWNWPWDMSWWKPTNRRRDFIKAGALIVAEIERMDRLSPAEELEPDKTEPAINLDIYEQPYFAFGGGHQLIVFAGTGLGDSYRTYDLELECLCSHAQDGRLLHAEMQNADDQPVSITSISPTARRKEGV